MRWRIFLDNLARWIAFKLPRSVVYHAYIRLHANATCHPKFAHKNPDQTTWSDALSVWVKP